MTWQDQLKDVVDRSKQTPTFQEWLTTIDYPDINPLSPVAARSVMITLYRRYQKEYGSPK